MSFAELLVFALIVYLVYRHWDKKRKQAALMEAMAAHSLAVANARDKLFKEENFYPARELHLDSSVTIWFDNDSNRIGIGTSKNDILFIDYGLIVGHELIQNGRSSFSGNMDSAVGGAIVGKVLFDNATAGAVVGAAGTTYDGRNICSSFVLALKFDDIDYPYVEIPLIGKEVVCDSAEYINIRNRAGELSALFDFVERRKAELKLKGGRIVVHDL